MPSAIRDPNSSANWIEPDYHRRPRGLRRWRSRLTWAALASTLVAVAAALALPRGRAVFQSGPLTAPHAFITDCARCHTDAFAATQRLWPGSAHATSVPDAACTSCHAGPAHNDQLLAGRSCASCHREHRGREALVRLPDADCLGCHADLARNSQRGRDTPYLDVTGYPRGHPEFALWRDSDPPRDPGNLHFNHQAHLKAEGVLGPDRRPTVLACESCHQLNESGRYMRPINYQNHCSACHPLSVALPGTDVNAQQASDFARIPAPHREPTVVRAVLRDRLLNLEKSLPNALAPHAEIPCDVVLPRSIQPNAPDPPPADQLRGIETLLFQRPGGCTFCHIAAPAPTPDGLPRYLPTQLSTRWLQHARFDHARHRLLACTECHPAPQSRRTTDVLLPRMATCVRCHDAASGARSDCVECHDYHDHKAHSAPATPLTISAALGR